MEKKDISNKTNLFTIPWLLALFFTNRTSSLVQSFFNKLTEQVR